MIRAGISGWNYTGWRGTFYPKKLPHREELEYASHAFATIEINGTFYRLQRPEHYEEWRRRTPAGFRFAVKGSRFITHMKKLRDVETALANFFASGVLRLEEKLGPVLWQFPAQMRFDPERFESFAALLPRTTAAAAELALHHDRRVGGRASTHADTERPIRHAIEIRHDSFLVPDFLAILRKHHIALVFSDGGPAWPYVEDVTAGFVYIRLHGDEELYASGYGDAALDRWAKRIRAWSEGREPEDAMRCGPPATKRAQRDVWVYFDNDAKVRAPFDARLLSRKLGLDWEERHPWPDGSKR